MKKLALAATLTALFSATAQADLTDDFKAQIQANQAQVESSMGKVSDNMVAVFAHRGLAPADTLGGGIGGFEIGMDLSMVDFDSTELQKASGTTNSDFDIDTLPLPKISAAVGLPVIPLDLAVTYFPETDQFSYLSAQVKYSILDGGIALPAVALAGNYSKASLGGALDVETMGLDASISKGFGVGVKIVPYAGIGYVSGTTTLNSSAVPANVNVKTEYETTAMKTFVGAGLQLGIINLVGQWDQIGEYQSYSAKVGIRF